MTAAAPAIVAECYDCRYIHGSLQSTLMRHREHVIRAPIAHEVRQ